MWIKTCSILFGKLESSTGDHHPTNLPSKNWLWNALGEQETFYWHKLKYKYCFFISVTNKFTGGRNLLQWGKLSLPTLISDKFNLWGKFTFVPMAQNPRLFTLSVFSLLWATQKIYIWRQKLDPLHTPKLTCISPRIKKNFCFFFSEFSKIKKMPSYEMNVSKSVKI